MCIIYTIAKLFKFYLKCTALPVGLLPTGRHILTFCPIIANTGYCRFLLFWLSAGVFHGTACCYAQFEVPFFNGAFSTDPEGF